MARKSKKGELYQKAWKRTERDTREERDMRVGRLRDYHYGKTVTMRWGVNPEMTADSMFILTIDGKDLFLDAEEFQKFLRWV